MLTQSNLGKILLVASALGAGLGSMPALAAQNDPVVVYGEQAPNTRTERVKYADLDLAKVKGAKQLTFRVGKAVKRVCGFYDIRSGLIDREYRNCADGAWANAKPQMALAIERAQQLALNGTSSLAAASITVAAQ